MLLRTVTESLLFQATLPLVAVPLSFVVVGVTAAPLAVAWRYFVVPPVATVTSPVVPVDNVTVGLVTLNVEPVPITVSVVGLLYPVTAVTSSSAFATTEPPLTVALSLVVVAEPCA